MKILSTVLRNGLVRIAAHLWFFSNVSSFASTFDFGADVAVGSPPAFVPVPIPAPWFVPVDVVWV